MRKKILFPLVVLALLLAVLAGGAEYLLSYAIEQPAHSYAFRWERLRGEYPALHGWLDSLRTKHTLRDTTITLSGGLRAHAFYLRGDSACGRTAICIHGYRDNALGMLPIAHIYNKVMRMNVLLPDLHAHGKSEGDAIQMGWDDRKDIEEWIPIAERMFRSPRHASRIVLHGISMGAATTMSVSGDSGLPAYVRAFIEDCGYTSVWDEFADQLHAQFSLPEFPLLPAASALCQLKYGWNFSEASPLRQVARCHRPMLFIHGDNDDFVPSWMVHPLYKAKPQPKALWVTRGCRHAQSYRDYPAEYTAKVRAFVERYLNVPSTSPKKSSATGQMGSKGRESSETAPENLMQ